MVLYIIILLLQTQLHKVGFISNLSKIESKLYLKNKDASEAWYVDPPPESTFRQSGSPMAVAGKYQRNCKYKVLEEDYSSPDDYLDWWW